jgi:hypothetical protein
MRPRPGSPLALNRSTSIGQHLPPGLVFQSELLAKALELAALQKLFEQHQGGLEAAVVPEERPLFELPAPAVVPLLGSAHFQRGPRFAPAASSSVAELVQHCARPLVQFASARVRPELRVVVGESWAGGYPRARQPVGKVVDSSAQAPLAVLEASA